MDILLITPRADFWNGLMGVFEKHGAAVRMACATSPAMRPEPTMVSTRASSRAR